jgi:hypothetical protein
MTQQNWKQRHGQKHGKRKQQNSRTKSADINEYTVQVEKQVTKAICAKFHKSKCHITLYALNNPLTTYMKPTTFLEKHRHKKILIYHSA